MNVLDYIGHVSKYIGYFCWYVALPLITLAMIGLTICGTIYGITKLTVSDKIQEKIRGVIFASLALLIITFSCCGFIINHVFFKRNEIRARRSDVEAVRSEAAVSGCGCLLEMVIME